MTALVLMGHGSPDGAAQRELLALRSQLGARLALEVRLGVLEFSSPGLQELESAFSGFAPSASVVAQPLLLFTGAHWHNDMPGLAQRKARELGFDLRLGSPFGDDPALVELVRSRLRAVGAGGGDVLLFVGRGSANAGARAQTPQVAAEVACGLGIAHEVCYAGISRPDVAEGMGLALSHHPTRVLVVPYLLHSGVLLRRVHRLAGRHADGCQVVMTDHLGNSGPLVNMLADRVESMLGRTPVGVGSWPFRSS